MTTEHFISVIVYLNTQENEVNFYSTYSSFHLSQV